MKSYHHFKPKKKKKEKQCSMKSNIWQVNKKKMTIKPSFSFYREYKKAMFRKKKK